jgi:hypothetical protein
LHPPYRLYNHSGKFEARFAEQSAVVNRRYRLLFADAILRGTMTPESAAEWLQTETLAFIE